MFGHKNNSKNDASEALIETAYHELYDDDDIWPNEKALNNLRMTSTITKIRSIINSRSASPAQKIIAIDEAINA